MSALQSPRGVLPSQDDDGEWEEVDLGDRVGLVAIGAVIGYVACWIERGNQ